MFQENRIILLILPKRAIIFITYLFNAVLRTTYFPLLWKLKVKMIPKPLKLLHLPTSYRPICLLPKARYWKSCSSDAYIPSSPHIISYLNTSLYLGFATPRSSSIIESTMALLPCYIPRCGASL